MSHAPSRGNRNASTSRSHARRGRSIRQTAFHARLDSETVDSGS